MLKKKHIVEIVSIAVIAFLIGTMLNVNLLTMAGKEEEDDSPPTWQIYVTGVNASAFPEAWEVNVANWPVDEQGNLKVKIVDENLWEIIYELQNEVDSLNASLVELLERVETLEMNQTQLLERIEILEEAIKPSNETVQDFIYDTFDAGLANWTYWGDAGYSLLWTYPGVVKIIGNGYIVNVGMQKAVDLLGWNGSEPLILSFNWRATSDAAHSSVTNAQLRIEDDVTHMALYQETLVAGGVSDTDWQSYSRDISVYMSGHNEIRIILWLRDAWLDNYHQENWYDNLRLTSATTP